MTISSRSQDKYAFLFTGPTAVGRFIKDIEHVFETLTQYYNYLASNITVALGSTDATPSVPGATVVNIASTADLQSALATFAAAASGPTSGLCPPEGIGLGLPSSPCWTTALLFFTGGGISETSGSKLVIDGGSGSNNVDPTWLTSRLNAFSDCHVNVVMQQNYAGGFVSALTGSTLSQWSFTSACTDVQQSYGNNTDGSFFTTGWLAGLKLQTLPAGTPDAGKYADELGAAGESSNQLIALEEAKEFGKQMHDWMGYGTFSTPDYSGNGGTQYLGLPKFLIRDGSNGIPWYESPDINLTHPNHPWVDPGNRDLFIPDPPGATPPYNNTINVDVRNVGTHPVRAYSLGIHLCLSGGDGVCVPHPACDILPAGGILRPIDLTDIETPSDQKDTYAWNALFQSGTTHRCAKAEAKLRCADVDFSWSVSAKDFEGQLNIEQMTIVPPLPSPPPLPIRNLQGFTEYFYNIGNPFFKPRRFILAFPEVYQQYKDVLELKWFAVPKEFQSELVPLKIVADDPVPIILFSLREKEIQDLLLRVEMKPDFDLEGEVRLPFDILVEGEWPEERVSKTALATRYPTFAPFAGFTVVVRQGRATLRGTVLDAENQPVADAKVFLRTVNDRQGTVLPTDRDGRYAFPDINPTIYRVWAEAGGWRSQEQTTVLLSGREEEAELILTEQIPGGGSRVKIVLDKIRILNDRDPCLKGKGELTFTSVIVPDNDESTKQVMRLPAEGYYHVSDRPGENDLRLEVTLFEGVVKNRSLSISISGKEIDWFDPNDELNRYHREFSGDPETWYGQYSPTDEYLDREDVGDWALWYRIVRN